MKRNDFYFCGNLHLHKISYTDAHGTVFVYKDCFQDISEPIPPVECEICKGWFSVDEMSIRKNMSGLDNAGVEIEWDDFYHINCILPELKKKQAELIDFVYEVEKCNDE